MKFKIKLEKNERLMLNENQKLVLKLPDNKYLVESPDTTIKIFNQTYKKMYVPTHQEGNELYGRQLYDFKGGFLNANN